MGDIKERIVIEAVDNTTRGMRSAQSKLNAFDRTLKRVQTTLMGFVGINIGVHITQALIRASDAAVELDAKLKLVTTGTEDYNLASEELLKISLESGSSLAANTILFTRMNKAIKSMGGTTQTTLKTTAALTHGLRISGASTQESASVIRQWSQAMASGVLRGEEFNAVSENGSRIIMALSEELGVNIGKLREMSKEGKLTAKVVTEALINQSEKLAAENAKLPLTMSRAFENINSQWTKFLQKFYSTNSGVAGAINTIAENFDALAKAIGIAFNALLIYSGVKAFTMFSVQARAVLELGFAFQRNAAIQAEAVIQNFKYDVALEKSAAKNLARMVQHEKNLNARILKEKELSAAKIKSAEVDVIAKEQALAKAIVVQKSINDELLKTNQLRIAKKDVLIALNEQSIAEAKAAVVSAKRANEGVTIAIRSNAIIRKRIALLIEEQIIQVKFASALGANKRIAEEARLNEMLRRNNLARKEEQAINATIVAGHTKIRLSNRALAAQQEKHNLLLKERTILVERNAVIENTSTAKVLALNEKLRISKNIYNQQVYLSNAAIHTNTAAINANTVAHGANIQVINASTAALLANIRSRKAFSTGFASIDGAFAKVAKGAKGLFAMFSRLGSALLGIPGLIALAAYEIGNYFFDWGVVIDVLWDKFQRFLLFIAENTLLGAFIPDSFFRDIEDKLDASLDKQIASYAEAQKAQKAGYSDVAEYRKSLIVKEKEEQLKRVQESSDLNAKLSRLKKDALDKDAGIFGEHLKRLEQLEGNDQESLDKKLAAIELDIELKKQGLIKEYKNAEDRNKKLAEIEKLANDKLYEITDEYLVKQIDRYKVYYESEIKLVKENNGKTHKLRLDLLNKLKTLNQSRIDNAKAMVLKLAEQENNAVKAARSAKEELKRIELDAKNFLLEINGDQRADWEKGLDTQKAISDETRNLKAADALDAKGKHKEAQALRLESIKSLKAIIRTEKKRSEDATLGAVDELKARSNTTNALNLFKVTVKKTADAQKELIASSEKSAENARASLESTKNKLSEFAKISKTVQSEINKINDLLSKIQVIKLVVDASDANAEIDKLETRIKELDKVISIKANVDTTTSGPDVAKADGGYISRADKVPGTGSGDKIKALLEPGEFIMRKSAVKKFGESAMYSMNRGEDPIRRKSGGIVAGIQKFASGGSVKSAKNLFNYTKEFYIKLMRSKIKTAYNTTGSGGIKGHLDRLNARADATKIKDILASLSDVKGKSPKIQADVIKINKEIYNAKSSSERFQLTELRDAIAKFNLGGMVTKFSGGGSVPGSSLGDTVRTLLTPGEFVVKKSAVQQFGSDFMNNINQGILPQKFADGGLVGDNSNSPGETISINLNLSGERSTGVFPKNDATMNLIDQLKFAEAST